MITARSVGGLAYPEKIEEMDKELTKVIEDFNHAVDVEVLRLVKRNGEHSLHQPGHNRSQRLIQSKSFYLRGLNASRLVMT